MDCDPRNIGRHGNWNPNDLAWQQLLAAGQELFADLKQLDPTRVYYSHAGADTGDFYTMNCYLDMLPLQERDDWLSEWAKSGQMPIGMCEFGTPMDCAFRRGHDRFSTTTSSASLC